MSTMNNLEERISQSFSQALSALKDSSPSLISEFNVHYPPTRSSSSKSLNHPKEYLLPALIPSTKSSPTLKTSSNQMPSISSSN